VVVIVERYMWAAAVVLNFKAVFLKEKTSYDLFSDF
jgi:hypothetical protein